MPPKKSNARKTAAQKKDESQVTEAQPQPETGSNDPDATQGAQPTEGQSAPNPEDDPTAVEPDQENPGQTDQEKFDAQQEEARQVQEGSEQSDDQSESEWPNAANYQPKHRPLQSTGLDQQAAHDEREAARDAQRDEHNERTASGILETQRGGRKVG